MMSSHSPVLIAILISSIIAQTSSDDGTPGSSSVNGGAERAKRQTEGCVLPDFPRNGRWILFNGEKRPGDSVPRSTSIRFECSKGYKLTAKPFIVCDKGWSDVIPECQKLCPPRFSTSTTILTCLSSEGFKISCSEATDGTKMTYRCTDNEIYESFARKKIIRCEYGEWDDPYPECVPVCGKKNADAIELSVGSRDTKFYEFPWVSAVFRRDNSTMKNNCGGTLITPRIVLTAAHCVVDKNRGIVVPEDEVEIAVAKQFLDYNDIRDKIAQFRKVSSIIVNEGFRPERRNQYDIALLVADRSFTLGREVQPACYDNIPPPHVGSIGVVSGWGLTEIQAQSDHLKTLEIPYKDQSSCSQELPSDFENRYNFLDKMCAGFYHQNKSVCKGDSGSGLVYINPQNNRYYVHGIVSVSPTSRDGTCNSKDNALLTRVAYYYTWIEQQSRIVERCTLPPHPDHGKWHLENGQERSPGQTVGIPTTILVFSCDDDYILSSAESRYYCASPRFPTCQMVCPLLYFTTESTVQCADISNQKIPCSDAAEGAELTFICPRETGGSQSGKIRCNDGNWVGVQPECVTATPQGPPTGTPKPPVIVTPRAPAPDMKVICTYDAQWYPNHKVIPEDFDPNLCTHLVYASMALWTKGDVKVRNDSRELDEEGKVGLFHRVADMKLKNPNLKILFNVGGAAVTDYNLFKRLVNTVGRTLGFLGSSDYFIKTYHFDGLNIDWDFPKESEKDRFIVFLERVKEDFVKNGWLLTATVRSEFNGTGYDIPRMNKILDWVTIKSYDLYGSETPYTGNHNALYASLKENDYEKTHKNMHVIANNWMEAGLSKEKLILSVAFHGRLSILTDSDNHSLRAPIVALGPNSGFLRYYEICSKYGGYVKVWDDEQKSPHKYKDKEWLSYNDETAVRLRAEYIRSNGFKGINVWPLDADDAHGNCGKKQVLLKAVHKGLSGTA